MARHRTTDRTAKKGAKFLGVLQAGMSVSKACKVAKLPRRTAYDWRESDALFAQAWDDAVEAGTDALEDEAVRRAKNGWLKPVYQGGKKVGTIQEFSDTLLIFSLKARRPQKFRDNVALDVTGKLTLEQLVAQIPVVEKT